MIVCKSSSSLLILPCGEIFLLKPFWLKPFRLEPFWLKPFALLASLGAKGTILFFGASSIGSEPHVYTIFRHDLDMLSLE